MEGRSLEELRSIANQCGEQIDVFLYNMLKDAMEENEELNARLEETFMNKYPFIVENGIICKKNKELDQLAKECISMKYEIKEWCNKYSKLNNKRNKALKYIREHTIYVDENKIWFVAGTEPKELEKILGEDNE